MRQIVLILIACGLLLTAVLAVAFFSASGSEPWGEKVAVVKISGMISFDSAGGMVGAQDITGLIEEAEENPAVKAIVLEINSPGGAPVASAEIARAVKDAEKPTVAWIGDIGTSGGYWVASAADTVMANPMSVTGAIGAYSPLVTVEGLMEKIGVRADELASGEFKTIGSPFRNVTPEEREILQEIVDSIHLEFVDAIAENRGMDVGEVKKLADGRPYTGRQALELGLVDELGDEKDAINKAGELAGIEEPETIILEPSKGWFPSILSGSISSFEDRVFSKEVVRT